MKALEKSEVHHFAEWAVSTRQGGCRDVDNEGETFIRLVETCVEGVRDSAAPAPWFTKALKKYRIQNQGVVVWDSLEVEKEKKEMEKKEMEERQSRAARAMRERLRNQCGDLKELGFRVTGLTLDDKEFHALISIAPEYMKIKDWHYQHQGFNIFRGSSAHFHVEAKV